MKKGLIILLSFLSIVSYSQKKEKYFYSENWKKCPENVATYFRLVNFDSNGKPIGNILDYYITGELQCNNERASVIDINDDANSVFFGKAVGFFKSGKKHFEIIRDEEGREKLNTRWYENGNKEYEIPYKNGKVDGTYKMYYENGKLKLKVEFSEGEQLDKWQTECDEKEICQKVFFENFESNQNNWQLKATEKSKSEIIDGKGLSVKMNSDIGYAHYVKLPLDNNEDFSIGTTINFVGGDKSSGNGIIYSYQDENNYLYFFINADGRFTTGALVNGLKTEFNKWTESSYIKKGSNRNTINISKVKDKVNFSINAQVVSTRKSQTLKGDYIGFYATAGKKEFYYEQLLVVQKIAEGVLPNFSFPNQNSNDGK